MTTTVSKSPLELGLSAVGPAKADGAQRRGVLSRNPSDPASFLLSHFDRLAEAPGGIAKLRGLILQLGVQGKLLPQNPVDEPVAKLIERVQADKKRMRAAKLIPPEKELPAFDDEEIPFSIPTSWSWLRLSAITHTFGQKVPDHRFTYIDVGAIDNKRGIISEPTVLEAADAPSRARKIVRKGAVLYSTVRPYLLNTCVIATDFNPEPIASTAFAVLNPHADISAHYLHYYLRSQSFISYVEEKMKGQAYPAINDGDMSVSPIPLPPLAEQRRIVAKVEELMNLCDALEAAQREREAVRIRLRISAMYQLASPDSNSKSAPFVLKNLTLLALTAEELILFRQTFFGLAVRGQLVPQNSNDEPAANLLSRINSERTKLLKSGYPNGGEASTQLRKQGLQVIPEGLAQLPDGWQWATLMQCSALVIDCHNKTAPYSPSGVILLRTTNIRDGMLNLKEPKFVDEKTYARWSARCAPEPGDILITREAPMGEVCIVPDGMKVCLGQRMMIVRLLPNTVDPKFMLYSLRDPNLMDRVQDKPVGATVQHLRVGGVETLLIPLPPLAEQRRIVAKVDELMAVLDQLEATLTIARTTSERLLAATIAKLHAA